MLKVGNHQFAIYQMYYKKKLGIIKSIYNSYFFYNFNLLEIIGIQTNDIQILANNIFASNEKKAIKII